MRALRLSAIVARCALLLFSACSDQVIRGQEVPQGSSSTGGEGGSPGTIAAVSVGGTGSSSGGGAPSTGSTGDLPTWSPAAFGDRCGLEVTRGPSPDVPRLDWVACAAPFDCGRWPEGSGNSGSLRAIDHLTRLDVQPGRTLFGARLFDVPSSPSGVAGVWDVASGDLVIAWRTTNPDCSVVAFPGGDRVWLSLQDLAREPFWQIHVDHQLEGEGYRVLEHDYVGPTIDGNSRFYVTSNLGGTSVWDADEDRWHQVEPRAFLWDLRDDGMHYIHADDADWQEWTAWWWAPSQEAVKVVQPPAGKSVVHVTSNDESLLWHVSNVDGGSPDVDQTTEVRRSPLPTTSLTEGELVLEQPFRSGGRASRTHYVETDPQVDDLLHVVDLATGVRSTLPLPPGVDPWVVHFVGDDGGGEQSAWFSAGGLVYRQRLPE